MWPVAFVGGLECEARGSMGQGRWSALEDGVRPHRPFAIGMAGFAVNLRLILQRSQAYFRLREA